MNLKVLLLHPGASWSTHDVYAGLLHGLRHHGVVVVSYRLDQRIDVAGRALHSQWRMRKKLEPDLPKPTQADVLYEASRSALELALREQVHVVFIVSAMFVHPDVIVLMKRAGLRVVVLFTESPYDQAQELAVARLVDGCWTNERTMVPDFRRVCRFAGYLPHGWHPLTHVPSAQATGDLPAHDVVFVGTGFPERVRWFNAIDWSGIDLGLYGVWHGCGLSAALQPCVRGGDIANDLAAGLYRRAKIGLNLYRQSQGWGRKALQRVHAESLSPRAYELAACGVFHLSDDRAEVREVFGDLVPTFRTPAEAATLIAQYLPDEAARHRIAEALPATVAEASWVHRAGTVLGDLAQLFPSSAAALTAEAS